jgi:YidC/Oxa1 family membrane protein insertase
MDVLRMLIEAIGDILYQVLLQLRAVTGNFGLAIILLTITIKIALLPLMRRQLQLARKVRTLAPRVAALREQFKDNPRQLRIELADLYRAHGVRPAIGMFLLLIQSPIFAGLWALFRRRNVFEGERFLGFPLDATPNLQAILLHPVWFLVPLLVALATFWQQHANAADPHQLLIFIVAAAAIGYFAMQVPVGMSLYWITYSLTSVAEAYLVGRGAGPEAAPMPHPQRPKGSKRKRRD